MAVTWLDTPGVPISKRETLDFIVDSLPVAISAGFVSVRPEERIYRDNVFLYPFLDSTIDGLGPYTFHLRRSGGWADDVTVYVDEGGGGAALWAALYEVDLTAQPTIPSATAGLNVIDGKNWYLKGNPGVIGGGVVETASLLNGSGLRITTNFAISYIGGGGGSPGNYLRWFLPFAQLSGFNSSLPLLVQWRLSVPGSTPVAFGGLCDSGNDSAGPILGATADHYCTFGSSSNGGGYAGSGSRLDVTTTASPGVATIRPSGDTATPATGQLAMFRANHCMTYASMFVGTSFVAPETMAFPIGSAPAVHSRPGSAAPTNLGFQFLPYDQTGGAGQLNYELTHLKISQPVGV